ncbi:MAG: cytochrome P450 [Pirellula sp.]
METDDRNLMFSGQLVHTPWFYKQWMLAGNRALFFDRLVRDFGDFIHYRGLFQFYLVNHPSLVKAVLQGTHGSFDKKSLIYNRFQKVFGAGLVVSEGETWRCQRKLMQPMFGPGAIKGYLDGMKESIHKMFGRWDVAAERKSVFDASVDMNHLTLEIAGQALFDDAFTQHAEAIHRWTHDINYYCGKPPLPIIRSFWFPSRLNRRLKTTLREFHAFLQETIEHRRGNMDSRDLLGILLRATHEETGQAMTDAEIRDELLGMIIGGHETSSAALTWIWYELVRNPDVERRLHGELDEVLGDQPLQLEHLPQLRYAKMIIDETLRLHPPFWFENRNAVCDVELGGVTIPKGSLVIFSRYSVHRNPKFWRSPDVFDPNRFQPGHEENARSTYASIPFGGGPRICIGIHFAAMELIVALAMIARRYRIRIATTDRHSMAAQLTMTPLHGLQVLVERREKS